MSAEGALRGGALLLVIVGTVLQIRALVLANRYRDAKERSGEWPRYPSVGYWPPNARRLQTIAAGLLVVGLAMQAVALFAL